MISSLIFLNIILRYTPIYNFYLSVELFPYLSRMYETLLYYVRVHCYSSLYKESRASTVLNVYSNTGPTQYTALEVRTKTGILLFCFLPHFVSIYLYL